MDLLPEFVSTILAVLGSPSQDLIGWLVILSIVGAFAGKIINFFRWLIQRFKQRILRGQSSGATDTRSSIAITNRKYGIIIDKSTTNIFINNGGTAQKSLGGK